MALISVITIVKDHSAGLIDTFASLAAQDFDSWEMIVVVGASKDSTLRTAIEMSNSDPRIKVIEQSGLGIYSAMNEGIENAGSEFVWFLNAGDRFADAHVLVNALDEITLANVGVIIGGYQIDNGNRKCVYSYPKKKISGFRFAFNRHGGCHQAMIFRTKLLRSAGGFDTTYSLASDFDLVLKIIKAAGAVRVPEIYAIIEPGGAADQGIFSVHEQKHQIRRVSFGRVTGIVLSSVWTIAARSKVTIRNWLRNAK